METFRKPLAELKEFEELEHALQTLTGVVQLAGCIDAAKPHIMYSCNNGSGSRIIVTFHEQKARELCEEYRFFDPNAVYYSFLSVRYPRQCYDGRTDKCA